MARRLAIATSEMRAELIAVAEKLLIAEGCSALTAGRLASEMGLSRPTIHYYFGTIDELIVAVLDYRAERLHEEIARVPQGENPLRGVWERRHRSSIFTFEVMTMALRRPVIRDALQRHLIALRTSISSSIATFFEQNEKLLPMEPDAMATAFLAISQAITVDAALGIEIGHDALNERVMGWLSEIGRGKGTKA